MSLLSKLRLASLVVLILGLSSPVRTSLADDSAAPVAAAPAMPSRVIAYTLSATVWNPQTARSEPTPPELIVKFRQVFALWASVPATGLSFRYDGLEAARYADPAQVPADGRLHLMLDTRYPMDKFTHGAGGFAGRLPAVYRKGYVFFNTRAGWQSLRFATMIHEVGHALGLGHGASIDAQMFCGSQLWTGMEYLAFSEQDRAALLAIWNPAAIYSLAGRVSGPPGQALLLHAVDVRNGRTFTALGETNRPFRIPITAPGTYRLFAKADESQAFDRAAPLIPSWYTAAGHSSNQPYVGAELTLSPRQRRIDELRFPAIQRPTPFNIWWAEPGEINGKPSIPAFLAPGGRAAFQLLYTGGRLRSLASYGQRPDYRLSALKPLGGGRYGLQVDAAPDAEPGPRLVLAPAADGTIQAGLVGIQILRGQQPGRLWADVAEQLHRHVTAAQLPVDYWRRP